MERQARITLFEDGSLSANGGCNRGRFQIEATPLHWQPLTPIIATQRQCNPSLMADERAFFAMLMQPAEMRLQSGQLILQSALNELVFSPADDMP